MASSSTDKIPHRERRPSVGAPIVDIQGSVGPAGISRPKHKRTLTGFGASEIKHVEGMPFFGCFRFASFGRRAASKCKLPELPQLPLTTNAGWSLGLAGRPASNSNDDKQGGRPRKKGG